MPEWLSRLADAFLADLRWYRRRAGGHWERWHLDGGYQCWYHLHRGCASPRGGNPQLRPAGVHGMPECEDWS